ncbi:MAG: response regulator, partial [Planctomycetota bacterium]
LPAGQKDPVLGNDQQSARFYARAVGARFLQPALARALKDKNTPVAVGLIEALYDTTPADALVQPVAGGVRPLVSALGHPDRHVRLLAAVSLANALPTQRFNGHDQVMWVLNEALRQTGKRTVLLVADDEAQRNRLQDVLRTLDCQVIDQPDSGKALTHIRTAGNVDVVLLTDRPGPTVFVNALRASPVLRQTPVVCASNRVAVQDFAKADKQMVILPAGAGPGALDQALNQALQQGAERPLTKEQAANWAVRAAKAIRLLGLTRNTVLDITQALTTLIETTRDPRAAVKVAAAEALAVMANADAQRAVAVLANNAKVGEAVRISAYKALAESLRRFGNQLTESQSQDVVTVVKSKASAALREAAAQALGAMNLPSGKVASVVTETVKSE